eukprot:CAMPEP_0194762170 /NCGR_PEP_ID=MMETSP0323_2-20130528/14807_1 /TAXON_ID=2866 ORGANISM="Crypthecodinium cohnii, Strain Seligo" /NCGR_SAMPLE_ID=MMETSP0323_2 /ASSEMBLY_ACC=CAM_ASM_000346 /LENGTH=179 /DNA_ID=CAMNT_0039684247 /DNA_START=28 /DNA_END=566 /DNA_ORIENTATION=-
MSGCRRERLQREEAVERPRPQPWKRSAITPKHGPAGEKVQMSSDSRTSAATTTTASATITATKASKCPASLPGAPPSDGSQLQKRSFGRNPRAPAQVVETRQGDEEATPEPEDEEEAEENQLATAKGNQDGGEIVIKQPDLAWTYDSSGRDAGLFATPARFIGLSGRLQAVEEGCGESA